MKLAINAFNIRIGGGVTHLVELLSSSDPAQYGFTEIAVWSNKNTLALLPDNPWLKKIEVPALNKNALRKFWWNIRFFSKEIKKYDMAYVPGGTYLGSFRPFVNFFQNALPFEPKEKRRFLLKSPIFYLKWNLLLLLQGLTFKRASAAVFPSYYLKSLVYQKIKRTRCKISRVIPHGINPLFFGDPATKTQSLENKHEIHIIYVSRIDFYKHQWHVVNAVALLRQMGISVRLDICGYISNKHAYKKMLRSIDKVDPGRQYIRYHGNLPYSSLPDLYKKTDIFVFASSCESISSILLEGMASGLAIACADIPVTKEVLKDAGVYFNPEDPCDIKNAIYQLISNDSLRQICKEKAFQYAKKYSWKHCADQTFSFLKEVFETTIPDECLRNRDFSDLRRG